MELMNRLLKFTMRKTFYWQGVVPFVVGLLFLGLSSCISGHNKNEKRDDAFFAPFEQLDGYNAKYRVGSETDSMRFHVTIKAMMTAFFDSIRYNSKTVYIIKHECGDSIVVSTDSEPLLSHSEFAEFYEANKTYHHADTVIRYDMISKFYIEPRGIVDIESIDNYPFMFMDVNFNGYPALLVRKLIDSMGYHSYYRYKVYGISPKGFIAVNYAPFNKIENRVNEWCYGGSTEFNYFSKTITTHNLAPGSCSDHGTSIKKIYTLNPATGGFDVKQIDTKYDCDFD
jgi:hypothetical protein